MKIKVEGMTCDNCVRTVKRLFSKIHGVDEVEIDLKNGIVEVKNSRQVPLHLFEEALEDTAYKVVQLEGR